jgi:cyclic beta-1,2-glucan synthetase
MIPYIEAPLLAPDQMDAYLQPSVSKIHGTVYEHCLKAIEHSMKFGEHGLPLIGAGDWNDGMNRLGIEGKGESVWLAWFQISVLKEFMFLCESRHDQEYSEKFRKVIADLTAAVEKHGWDGEWYRRGYDDQGVPFGSSQNQECKIDSIAQSWAVLSHAADPSRSRQAMESVERVLIRSKDQLALLFTPPFVDTPRDPGYIKGYLAGIRENGGQYNHAAVWLIAAFAELSQAEKAFQIFQMCSPVHRSSNREKAEKYKVEPYAAAGDIYSHPSHVGRGGWSWYTGSAGWLYRAGLEWILGFRLEQDHFTLKPSIPAAWPGYQITFRHGAAIYHIKVDNKSGDGHSVKKMELNGQSVEGNSIKLSNTPGTYNVTLLL